MRERRIAGQVFGRLTAVRRLSSNKWLFKCSCGGETVCLKGNVMAGKTKSCGCLRKEATRSRRKTHGLTGTKVYRTWRHMLDRCYNPNVERYANYGGRGVTVCERWRRSVSHFFRDMGAPPTKSHSIGRIKNDIGYCPQNCQWETATQQARNKTSTILSLDLVRAIRADLSISGAEWGRIIGTSKELINQVRRNEIWV